MSEAKTLLARRGEEALKATKLFIQAISGESRAVGKKIAVETARERGRNDLASVIDAEFEEDK